MEYPMRDAASRSALEKLKTCEELDDVDVYLKQGEWDEPPLYTRLRHLNFLDGLDLDEKNRILFGAALLQADRIVNVASQKLPAESLGDFLCIVTVMEWGTSEPIVPHFLTSTKAREEFGALRFMAPVSEESKKVIRWLDELGRTEEFVVLDSEDAPKDAELLRIYVGHRRLPHPAMLTLVSWPRWR
jgi:hypothetical protein